MMIIINEYDSCVRWSVDVIYDEKEVYDINSIDASGFDVDVLTEDGCHIDINKITSRPNEVTILRYVDGMLAESIVNGKTVRALRVDKYEVEGD